MSRATRLLGLAGLGLRRVLGRAAGRGRGRVLLSVGGVALAVTLMTVVTGVALGLGSQSAVQGEAVDYWIVPGGRTTTSIVAPTGGPSLGRVHPVTDRLRGVPGVTFATPVLLQVVPVQDQHTGDREFLLLVGVLPDGTDRRVVGLPTGPLAPGDPYYADGGYDGRWTGELVLSRAGATVTNASVGDTFVVNGSRTGGRFTVVNVSAGGVSTGIGPAPVGIVHLSELQAIVGATNADTADQFLVSTDTAGVRDRIAGIYPSAEVVTRAGFATETVSLSSLPAAMAVAAFLVAVVVGALFVATLMGLEVTASRAELATLAAVGVGDTAQLVLVLTETVVVGLLGGLLGSLLGALGILAVNAAAGAALGIEGLALFRPALLGYGILVAVLISLLAAPYPLWLARRTDLAEVLRA